MTGSSGPIDNDVYNRLDASWWDEDNPLNLHGSLTPARMAYFHEVLRAGPCCAVSSRPGGLNDNGYSVK
ncbi:hypothetical protein [Pseudarthrobacter oxydans]|uniref:hypothetical protein n=1 Tax=Pseudarthrobacter oxydans TaxID=1671 RepID=UPI003800991E